jgi:magnesium chelatase family protein
LGIEAQEVEVQCSISSGLPAFNIVGLADKAVAESKERIRSAFYAIGLSLPAKRITINLAPANIPKEGSHYDLPIALALLAAIDLFPPDELHHYIVIGELSLDGSMNPVFGAISAAINAAETGRNLICPSTSGSEAAIIDTIEVIAPRTLSDVINHLTGKHTIPPPEPAKKSICFPGADLADIRGQETAKRALEIAAAGGHNMLMIGPPGSGKSMMAYRIPSILPPLSPEESLEVLMIHSLSGLITDGKIPFHRPYRAPHHSASIAAMVGGGRPTKPGEVTLAHNGVLFLDELPEFSPAALDSLRQPLELGYVTVARAHARIQYPSRHQLITAMNPCKCGYLLDKDRACSKAPLCAANYQGRVSGPLFDRIDLHVEMTPLNPIQLTTQTQSESSDTIAKRVQKAYDIQQCRCASIKSEVKIRCNAHLTGAILEAITPPDSDSLKLLCEAIEKMKLTARGYYRTLRIARTIADLEGADNICRHHVAEALSFRYIPPIR